MTSKEQEGELSKLRSEKESMLRQIEEEEEYLTNTLQKKLMQLRQEKENLARDIESEQEYITNRLQFEVISLQRQKEELKDQLASEAGVELAPEFWVNWETVQAATNKVQRMAEEMKVLTKNAESSAESAAAAKADLAVANSKVAALEAQNKSLQDDKFILQQKLLRVQEMYLQMKENAKDQTEHRELDHERHFNDAERRKRRGGLNASMDAGLLGRGRLRGLSNVTSLNRNGSLELSRTSDNSDTDGEREQQLSRRSSSAALLFPVESVHALDESTLVKSGLLMKTHGSKQAQRFVKLYSTKDCTLFEAEGKSPCAFVNLRSASHIEVDQHDALSFRVVTAARAIRFRATDASEAAGWVKAFDSVVSAAAV